MSYRAAIDVILERIPEAITDFNGSSAVPGEGWLASNTHDDGGYHIPLDFERPLFIALFDYYFKRLRGDDIANIIGFVGMDGKWHERFVDILGSLPGGANFRPSYDNNLSVEPNKRWAHNMCIRQKICYSHASIFQFSQNPYLILGKSATFHRLFGQDQDRTNALKLLDEFTYTEKSLGYCIDEDKLRRQNIVEFFFEDEVTGMLFAVKYGDRIIL